MEVVAGVGGAVLLVSLLLPWFEPGRSGLSSMAVGDLFVAAAALIAIGLPLLSAGQQKTDLPVVVTTISVIASGIAIAIVVYRLIDPIGGGRGGGPLSGPGGIADSLRGIAVGDGRRGALSGPPPHPASRAASPEATRLEKAITVIIGLTRPRSGTGPHRRHHPLDAVDRPRRCRRPPPTRRRRSSRFPSGECASRRSSAARKAGRLEAGEVPRPQDAGAADVRIDLRRARGEVDLRRPGDAEGQPAASSSLSA